MAIFGVLGYVFVKLDCEPAPLLLGFILGPLMEENLRRALLLSRGDPTTFVTKPISAGFLIASVILLLIVALPAIRKKREEAFVAEEVVRRRDARSRRPSGSRSGIAPAPGGR